MQHSAYRPVRLRPQCQPGYMTLQNAAGPQPWVCGLQGDGTVTYQDPFSAASAVQWFNGKEFKGVIHQATSVYPHALCMLSSYCHDVPSAEDSSMRV